jgi:deoxyribodipyrimidine photo-lyase
MKSDFAKGAWGIHWFRRDLRVAGNEALRENFRRHQGRVLGLFCFDSKFLARSDFSSNRFAFFLNTLKALRDELQAQGGDLLVIDSVAKDAFPKLCKFLETENLLKPSVVSYGRDYEPYARKRDEEMNGVFQKLGIEVVVMRDHLILEPDEVMKDEKGGFYQVYSPFAKKWFANIAKADKQLRLSSQKTAQTHFTKIQNDKLGKIFELQWKSLLKLKDFPFVDAHEEFKKQNQKNVTIAVPAAGFVTAYQALLDFQDKITTYKDARDFPSVAGTSRMSIFLKNGSISSSQIFNELGLSDMSFQSEGGANQYAKEIVWREFYYSILFHRPDVEHTSFLSIYKDLPWENNKSMFERWKSGTTGFPIVDAGMRELNETGWMHNRVRMIVASFLTKDLLIDWKWGENYFMKQLLDGDLAPNNGGWQWAASTGCDPQPYFRIFNPWLQGEKFDPDGTYIQQYVPELRGLSPKVIHDPDADRSRKGYPTPIVEHSVQRDKAIELYKKIRKSI